jgi:glutaconyl-CoA/methylmalonyl-CoA decarboxylase subunit gamma
MKRYQITLEDQTYLVEVLSDPRQREVKVRVDGELLTVQAESLAEQEETSAVDIAQPAPRVVSAPAVRTPAPQAVGPGVVKSPLPGVIKSIKVHSGDTVAFNDELLVIEAMKAMNIIRAPQAGTVGTIYVTEGRQVPHGAPLLDLK